MVNVSASDADRHNGLATGANPSSAKPTSRNRPPSVPVTAMERQRELSAGTIEERGPKDGLQQRPASAVTAAGDNPHRPNHTTSTNSRSSNGNGSDPAILPPHPSRHPASYAVAASSVHARKLDGSSSPHTRPPQRHSRPPSASLHSLRSDCDTLLSTTTTTTGGSHAGSQHPSDHNSNNSAGGFAISTLEGMLGAHLKHKYPNQKVTHSLQPEHEPHTGAEPHASPSRVLSSASASSAGLQPPPLAKFDMMAHTELLSGTTTGGATMGMSASSPAGISEEDDGSSLLGGPGSPESPKCLATTVREGGSPPIDESEYPLQGVRGGDGKPRSAHKEDGATAFVVPAPYPAAPSPSALDANGPRSTGMTPSPSGSPPRWGSDDDNGVARQTTTEALRDAMTYIAALAAGRGAQLTYPPPPPPGNPHHHHHSNTSGSGPLGSSSSSVFSSSASTAVPPESGNNTKNAMHENPSVHQKHHSRREEQDETERDPHSRATTNTKTTSTGNKTTMDSTTTRSHNVAVFPVPSPPTHQREKGDCHHPQAASNSSSRKKKKKQKQTKHLSSSPSSSCSSSSSSSSSSSNNSFQRWRQMKDAAAALPLHPPPLRILPPSPHHRRRRVEEEDTNPQKRSTEAKHTTAAAAHGRNMGQQRRGEQRTPSASSASPAQRARPSPARQQHSARPPLSPGRSPAALNETKHRGQSKHGVTKGNHKTTPSYSEEEEEDDHHKNSNNNSLSDSYNNNNNNNNTASSILISSGGSSPRFLCPHPPSKEPTRVLNAKERFAYARQVISSRNRLSPSPPPAAAKTSTSASAPSPPPSTTVAAAAALSSSPATTDPSSLPHSLPLDHHGSAVAIGGSSPLTDSPILSPTSMRREMQRRQRTEQQYKYIKKSPLERIRRENSNTKEMQVEQARRRNAKALTTPGGKTTWRERVRAAERQRREASLTKDRQRRETEEKLLSRGTTTTTTTHNSNGKKLRTPAGKTTGSAQVAAGRPSPASSARLRGRQMTPTPRGRTIDRSNVVPKMKHQQPVATATKSRSNKKPKNSSTSRSRTGGGKRGNVRVYAEDDSDDGNDDGDDDDDLYNYGNDGKDVDPIMADFLDEDDENEILLMLSEREYKDGTEGDDASGRHPQHHHHRRRRRSTSTPQRSARSLGAATGSSSASNFSLRSTGGRTTGTFQSVPSFSIVARAEVYQRALRSALPRYLPNGTANANLEVRDELQAVLDTLQRLHASARQQMRHLNQQIDEACKALRYLKADIAECESQEETQRRMRWELHLEQHRRHRLMQLLYTSKKSLEQYKMERAVHLEKEVNFCSAHKQPCIFSNKIEASFAGGRLSAHRRLTASLHAMHQKADQLAKDITRTKTERRLVMASAAYQQHFSGNRRVVFGSAAASVPGSPNGSVTFTPGAPQGGGGGGGGEGPSLTALLAALSTTASPTPMKGGGAGAAGDTFAGFQLVRNAKDSAPNVEEAWYMEDEIRRNEVQERDMYQAVVLIQKRIKRKTEEIAELEDRKARVNRFDESREAHRVERQLFRSESASELIALKRRQSAGLVGQSRRNTLLQMTPQRIERGRGLRQDSDDGDGMLSIHSETGEPPQRHHHHRHKHRGGPGGDSPGANNRTLSPWNTPPKEKTPPYTFLTELL